MISGAVKGYNGDYIAERFEQSERTYFSYRNCRLAKPNSTGSSCANFRTLGKGGWGFGRFNCLDGLRDRAALAAKKPGLASGEAVQCPSPRASSGCCGHRSQEAPGKHARAKPLWGFRLLCPATLRSQLRLAHLAITEEEGRHRAES